MMFVALGTVGGAMWHPGVLHPARLSVFAGAAVGVLALRSARVRAAPVVAVAIAAVLTALVIATFALYGGGARAEGVVQLALPTAAVVLHMAVSPAFSLAAAAATLCAFFAAPAALGRLPLLPRPLLPLEPLNAASASFLVLALALVLASSLRTEATLRRLADAQATTALEAARADAILAICMPGRRAEALRAVLSRDWRCAGAGAAAATAEELAVVFVRLPALGAADLWGAAPPPGAAHVSTLDELALAWELATYLAAARGISIVEAVGCELVAFAPVGGGGEEACVAFARDLADALAGVKAHAPIHVCAGVASGLVSSGIVGGLMPQYCLVGSTVNLAARMASIAEDRASMAPALEAANDGGRGFVVVAAPAATAQTVTAETKGGEIAVESVKGFAKKVSFVVSTLRRRQHGDLGAPPPPPPSSLSPQPQPQPQAQAPQLPQHQEPPAAVSSAVEPAPSFLALGSPDVDSGNTMALMALGLSLVIARAAFFGETLGASLAAGMTVLTLVIRATGMHAAAFGALLCAVVALPLCAPTATASAFDAVLAACAMSILHGAGNVPSVIALAAFLVAVARWGRDETARSLLVLTFFAFDVVRVSRKELTALHTALSASQATAAASASATVALIGRMLPQSVALLVASQPALLDSTRGAVEFGAAAEAFSDVALISADLVGFTSLCEFLSAGDALLVLNDVIARLEAAAVASGATKVRTVGDCFIAACGLGKDADAEAGDGRGKGGSGGAAAIPAPPPLQQQPSPLPPPPQTSARARAVAHAVRAAFAFHAVLEEDGNAARTDALPERLVSAIKRLRLRIGIHVGSVTYGVICVAGARTDAWGPAAAVVKDVEHAAPPGGTLLSEEAALALAEHLAAKPASCGLRVRLEAREGGRVLVEGLLTA